MQCSAVQCSALFFSAVQCSAAQISAALVMTYSTTLPQEVFMLLLCTHGSLTSNYQEEELRSVLTVQVIFARVSDIIKGKTQSP